MNMDAFQQRINHFTRRFNEVNDKGLYFYLQGVDSLQGARVVMDGKEKIMFSSYSYLGLLEHPKIRAAARAAVDEFGSGTHGVRILAGTTRLHEELEETMARFMGVDDTIAYSSGYVANVATISALLGDRDMVVTDSLSHASIIDGCRLSKSTFLTFKHNDLKDLERILGESKDRFRGKLVIVDAVYSMDGDVAPLPELVEIANKYGAWLMVDEAHSLGVLGKTGRGIIEYFGMPKDSVHILTGSLSKAIPAVGGYVAGKMDFIRFLKHNARGFVFSAALPPAAVAAAKAAFEVIDEEPWRLENLRKNISQFIEGLHAIGYNTLNTRSSVIPIIIGNETRTLMITRLLHDEGVFICPILPPAVPYNTCRLRANVTAAHTEEDLQKGLDALERAGRKMGVIGEREAALV